MNPVPSPLTKLGGRRSASAAPSPAAELRLAALRALPWRPAAKLMLSAAVVVGLAWLGARNASSEPLPVHAAAVATEALDAQAASSPSGSGSGRDRAEPPGSSAPAEPRPVQGILLDGRVVLNHATEQDLRKLPGVGPARAAAILALRTKLGRFRSARDLLRIRGIGVKTLKRLEPKMVVDPPPGG